MDVFKVLCSLAKTLFSGLGRLTVALALFVGNHQTGSALMIELETLLIVILAIMVLGKTAAAEADDYHGDTVVIVPRRPGRVYRAKEADPEENDEDEADRYRGGSYITSGMLIAFVILMVFILFIAGL